MHAIGLFNLFILTCYLITHGIEATIENRMKYGELYSQINNIPEDRQRPNRYKNPFERTGRIKRNKEKIPLMIGKATKVSSNKTKVNGLLSDLKVDCRTTEECGEYLQSYCSPSSQCNCTLQYPVFVASQKSCIKAAALNASCSFTEQCTHTDIYSECGASQKICLCVKKFYLKEFPEIGIRCVTKSDKQGTNGVDPAMIGVLVGLVLMFVIICVVLRLFSKARFRENRSIFNTPNPRLMNASLFKDSKLLSPARGTRRGSSVRIPSRTASICSVNKDTPRRSTNGSLNKERRGSALSNVSATGSASGTTVHARAMSTTGEHKDLRETTVAIEAVD